MVKVAVLAGASRAATGSSDCVQRLEAALSTREEGPDASDHRGKRRLFSQTPPKLPFSLHLTIQVHDLDLLILNVLVVAASAAVAVVAMITRAPASKSRPALHMALPSGHGRASCAGEPSPGAPGPLQLWACRLRT